MKFDHSMSSGMALIHPTWLYECCFGSNLALVEKHVGISIAPGGSGGKKLVLFAFYGRVYEKMLYLLRTYNLL
jgi:hypothetical protein